MLDEVTRDVPAVDEELEDPDVLVLEIILQHRRRCLFGETRRRDRDGNQEARVEIRRDMAP